MDNFPNLFIIVSKTTYMGMFGVGSQSWAEANIINNHGPLGAIYPPKAIAGTGVIEGDSPSFLYLVSANRGINNPDDPTQPGWGGQYIRVGKTNHYTDGLGKQQSLNGARIFNQNSRNGQDGCYQNILHYLILNGKSEVT